MGYVAAFALGQMVAISAIICWYRFVTPCYCSEELDRELRQPQQPCQGPCRVSPLRGEEADARPWQARESDERD